MSSSVDATAARLRFRADASVSGIGAWLDPSLGTEEVPELCGAILASRLLARPANPALNRAGGVPEGPELLQAPRRQAAHLS
jgi:hypothetical protein